jgi:hypothetical protein
VGHAHNFPVTYFLNNIMDFYQKLRCKLQQILPICVTWPWHLVIIYMKINLFWWCKDTVRSLAIFVKILVSWMAGWLLNSRNHISPPLSRKNSFFQHLQLFQLRLSPSKAGESNTSGKVEYERERLLGIANKLMNLLAIPSSLSRSYSTFLVCSGTTLIEIAVYKQTSEEQQIDKRKVSFRLHPLSLFNKIDLNCYVYLTLSNDKLLSLIF